MFLLTPNFSKLMPWELGHFKKKKKTTCGELSTAPASPASTTGQDIILGSGACGIFCGVGIFYGGGAAALSRK